MTDLNKLTSDLINKCPELDINDFWYSDLMGSIVFARRIKAGLTQPELADLVGIDVKLIHRIEGGSDKDVTTRIFDKIFNALNITSKELGKYFSENNM